MPSSTTATSTFHYSSRTVNTAGPTPDPEIPDLRGSYERSLRADGKSAGIDTPAALPPPGL